MNVNLDLGGICDQQWLETNDAFKFNQYRRSWFNSLLDAPFFTFI